MKKNILILLSTLLISACSMAKPPNNITQPRGSISAVNPDNIKESDLEAFKQ